MNTKKILALVLSIALVLSVVISVPFSASALTGYTWYSCNPNKGGWADYNMFPAPDTDAEYLGNGWWNSRSTTIEEFEAAGWFDKAQTPYATFYLNATQDTTVNLAPAYSVGAANGATLTDYSMTVFVNDKDYYVGDGSFSGTGSTYVAEGSDMIYNVKLTKGLNIVRMVATGKADGDTIWANLNGLCVQNKDDVTVEQVSEVTYMTGTSTYLNGYADTEGDGTLGGAWSNGTAYNDYYWSNVNVHSNYSVTVDVPADGYYEFEQYINTGKTYKDGDAHIGYIAVFVDGVKHKVGYQDYDNSRNSKTSAAGTSLYLTKGTHIITVSEGMDRTVSGAWFNMGKLILRGGVTIAATQLDPSTITTDPSLAYPDTDAHLTNMRADSTQSVGNGHGLVTFYTSDVNIADGSADLQGYSSMVSNGISDNRIVSADYSLKVDSDGTYLIKPSFNIGSGSGYDPATEGYFVAVAVNNKNFYKYEVSALGYYDAEFNVELEAGVNSVRIIFLCNDTKGFKYPDDLAWVNHQYLRLGDGIEVVAPSSFTKNAATCYLNGYENQSTQAGNVGSYNGSIGLSDSGLTSESVTAADFYRIPYVSFTVDVQYDGYYDFTIVTGLNSTHNGAIGNINAFVDSVKQNVYFYQTQNPTTARFTLYISKGTRIITLTSVWEYTKSALIEQYITWCDYRDIVSVSGGISLASTQIDPQADVSIYKDEHIAIVEAQRMDGDCTEADEALDALVEQINNYTGDGKTSSDWQTDLAAISSTAETVAKQARETAFAAVVAAGLEDLETARAIYPGDADTATTIDPIVATLEALEYDHTISYTENITPISIAVSPVASTINAALAADLEAFEVRRAQIIERIQSKATDVDSPEVTQIIANSVATAQALPYDINLDLSGTGNNYSRLAAINSDNNSAMAAQRAAEKANVEELKTTVATAIEGQAAADDTAAMSAAIAAAKANAEGYTYDETITYADNMAAVNALATDLATELEAMGKAVTDQLHVWKQVQANVNAQSESAYVRFIFTLDTTVNTYTDYGFYITIGGETEKYSYNGYTYSNLGNYDALYFDNSDKANAIVYVYMLIPNVGFGETVEAQSYFTDANGEFLGNTASINLAERFAQ